MKRTVSQSIFDSPDALRIAKEAHRQACIELENTPRYKLDKGNPNHPDYDLHIFGIHIDKLMAMQYKKKINDWS